MVWCFDRDIFFFLKISGQLFPISQVWIFFKQLSFTFNFEDLFQNTSWNNQNSTTPLQATIEGKECNTLTKCPSPNCTNCINSTKVPYVPPFAGAGEAATDDLWITRLHCSFYDGGRKCFSQIFPPEPPSLGEKSEGRALRNRQKYNSARENVFRRRLHVTAGDFTSKKEREAIPSMRLRRFSELSHWFWVNGFRKWMLQDVS